LYLGSLLDYEKLPWQIREINKAMSPLLSKFGYRNFLATEIRVKDNVPYFIDPTFRMAGLTEDQLPVTCSNLADVIWQGANGNLIEPQFVCDYVSVATMHFTSHQKDHWFQLHIPEEAKQWAKLYHYCQLDGMHHFIPSVPLECDEAGVVIGIGNTIEESIESLKQNFALLKAEPLRIEETGFADLLKQVKKAESEGMEFSDQPIPQPEIVLK
jgi:hypothetical protein